MELLVETDIEDGADGHGSNVESTVDGEKIVADLEYIFQQRAMFTSNIHLADQKSGYIALLHGVLITGFSSIMQNDQILTRLTRDSDKFFYIFSLITLFLSFIANMLAFSPRARPPAAKDHSWTDIANGDVDALVNFIMKESMPERVRRGTAQVKTLAKICNEKFTYIKYSIILIGISMTSSILLYVRIIMP